MAEMDNAPAAQFAQRVVRAEHYESPGQVDVLVSVDGNSRLLIQIEGITSLDAGRAAFLEAWATLGAQVAAAMTTQSDDDD